MIKDRISQIANQNPRPCSAEEWLKSLALPRSDLAAIKKVLADMAKEGRLVKTSKGLYAPIQSLGYGIGILRTHAKGFAHIQREEGEDWFVPPGSLGDGLHGDRVLARLTSKGNNRAEVVRVLDAQNHLVTGTLKQKGGQTWLQLDEPRLALTVRIEGKSSKEALPGQQVVVALSPSLQTLPDDTRLATGRVMRVLGNADDPNARMLSVAYNGNLRVEYAESALAEADKIPQQMDEKALVGRKDFRDKTVFTIDGADAKDLDDAVSIDLAPDGSCIVYVHIADVSHYVLPGSPLDNEAKTRGTSCYFPGLTLHMLPLPLSAGICSLHPQVDRLTMTCQIHFDALGNRIHAEAYPSCIRSVSRLTYEDVNRLFSGQPCEAKTSALSQPLLAMRTLSHKLQQLRSQNGGLDFDLQEAKIDLDETGHVTKVSPRDRGDAERLIEALMLAANESVADLLSLSGYPVLFRIHEAPKSEKLDDFLSIARLYGVQIQGKHLRAAQIPQILRTLQGQNAQRLLEKQLLRALPKAKYSAENPGHFGLASPRYCHFTSPIRRYPDLIIHRLLKAFLSNPVQPPTWQTELPSLGISTSFSERQAMEAERQAIDIRRAEYLERFLGQSRIGTISGITPFGCFVEFPDTCEGLLRIEDLPSARFVYDARHQQLVAKRSGQTLSLGQSITVMIAGVDIAAGQVFLMPG